MHRKVDETQSGHIHHKHHARARTHTHTHTHAHTHTHHAHTTHTTHTARTQMTTAMTTATPVTSIFIRIHCVIHHATLQCVLEHDVTILIKGPTSKPRTQERVGTQQRHTHTTHTTPVRARERERGEHDESKHQTREEERITMAAVREEKNLSQPMRMRPSHNETSILSSSMSTRLDCTA